MYIGSAQPGAVAPFTATEAQLIPQSDRMGKAEAWRLMDTLRDAQSGAQSTDAALPDALDLTDGTLFPWRLWLCNLGHLTDEAVGCGIVRVMLRLDRRVTISLMLFRADGSSCALELMRRDHPRGGVRYTVELTEQ